MTRCRYATTHALLVASLLIAGTAAATHTDAGGEPPSAAFTWSPTSPRDGETVQFTDASADADDNLTRWSWDFGDGSRSVERHPAHAFRYTGPHLVTLRVVDAAGHESTAEALVQVEANAPPDAAFSFQPAEPLTRDPIAFVDASSDPDGAVAAWAWDLGDGTRSSARDVTHAYKRPGAFTVRLTVTDDLGGTGTTERVVVVGSRPPVASFVFEPESPRAGDRVTFTSTSTDPDDAIVAWAWDFGDGRAGASAATATRSFDVGFFDITLSVTDAAGGTASTTATMRVARAPNAEPPVPPGDNEPEPQPEAPSGNDGDTVVDSGPPARSTSAAGAIAAAAAAAGAAAASRRRER